MKILLISLGCDKNLVDSEFILGNLVKEGFELTDNECEADIIIVNTCAFIGDAKEESIETILDMAQYKEEGNCRLLVVCGCLSQRYHNEIKTEIPEVDIIIGATAYEDIVAAISEALAGNCEQPVERLKDINYLPAQNTKRLYSTGTEYSYLKIAEGCNKRCTYCAIPYIRGSYRSVPEEDLISQAEYLASVGVKELIVVAQDTTLYGLDLYGEKRLPKLLNKLCAIKGIEWIRLLYAYPEDVTEELAKTIADNPKICHYIDMPIQHASDNILKKMGRRTNQAEIIEKINMLRSIVPDIAVRTTLITGFPGETKEDHTQLLEFIKNMRFERLGVFCYSPEENTPAVNYPNQIDEETKSIRYNELMELQQQIAFDMAKNRVGENYNVVIEGEIPEDNVYLARTMYDAPSIDGCVFLPLTGNYMTGDIVNVNITKASGYDLLGIPNLI
ncbi:MAG: 30S ribosomal protein S12 methylthiotransferase RimO [Lachnospiraceae bacterium]|nr:30S ribosomal protein S12 methylthiotransferase RimO [Lachnospiraceae bacterium]